MKKFLALLFVLAIIASLPLTAFAATGINANEQAVLDLLDSTAIMGANNSNFEIPQKYINTAKNYFAGDCDITAAQKDAIIAYIKQGIEIVKAEANAQKFKGEDFKLSSMTAAARSKVLDLGKKACAEINLQLSYDSKKDAVIITEKGTSTPVFESAPIVKATGEAVTVNGAFVGTIVMVCLALSAGAMYFISKKNGLFVK